MNTLVLKAQSTKKVEYYSQYMILLISQYLWYLTTVSQILRTNTKDPGHNIDLVTTRPPKPTRAYAHPFFLYKKKSFQELHTMIVKPKIEKHRNILLFDIDRPQHCDLKPFCISNLDSVRANGRMESLTHLLTRGGGGGGGGGGEGD